VNRAAATEETPQALRGRWDWPYLTPALGCASCRFKDPCGGMCVAAGDIDCLGNCCGAPEGCVRACPKNPAALVMAMREIGGTFEFERIIPRTVRLAPPMLPNEIALIDHRGSVGGPRALNWACLKLTAFFTRDGQLRFKDGGELRRSLGLDADAAILLSGIDQDDDVEAWWGVGLVQSRLLIRAMPDFGIAMVTTPNFSLALTEVRPTQMHAMSRIALTNHEFLIGRVPSALHLGASTERDYERWGDFLAPRDEITHVAVDFSTGPARVERRDFHLDYLRALAARVGRPLHLVLKGRVDVIAPLARSFAGVTYVDTTAFQKTLRRRRLLLGADGQLFERAISTAPGEKLDDLWEENWLARQSFLAQQREQAA
jgi:hypothetical protein